jgi:hypothetical protein
MHPKKVKINLREGEVMKIREANQSDNDALLELQKKGPMARAKNADPTFKGRKNLHRHSRHLHTKQI